MANFRFIEYVATPSAKQMGVAYIALNTDIGEIMLGFKVVSKKDGNGYFIAEPTWKLEENGAEDWKTWIMIDSNIAKEQLFGLVRENVNRLMAHQPQQTSNYQQPNYGGQQNYGAQPSQGQGQNKDDVPF